MYKFLISYVNAINITVNVSINVIILMRIAGNFIFKDCQTAGTVSSGQYFRYEVAVPSKQYCNNLIFRQKCYLDST